MLIDDLIYIFGKSKCASNFFSLAESGEGATLNVASSARPLFASLLWKKTERGLLVLIAGSDAAHKFARATQEIVGFDNVVEFPDFNITLDSGEPSDAAATSKRFSALDKLESGDDKIFVASTHSILTKLPGLSCKWHKPLVYKCGDEIEDLDEFFESLAQRGFVRVKKVSEAGEFSFKGGAVDIFCGSGQGPLRLDLFGDEIESIRRVFASTGQTIGEVEIIEIYPVCELPLTKKNVKGAMKKLEVKARTNKQIRELFERVSESDDLTCEHLLLPYLCETASFSNFVNPALCTLVCEPTAVLMDMQRQIENLENSFVGTSAQSDDFISSVAELNFSKNTSFSFQSIMQRGLVSDDEVKVLKCGLAAREQSLREKIEEWQDGGHFVVFGAGDPKVRSDFCSKFSEAGISFDLMSEKSHPKRNQVNVEVSDITNGFVIPSAHLAMFGTGEFQSQIQNFRRRNSVDLTKITFPFKVGDFVVHSNFGVARFASIVRRELDGVERDYMELEYAENDKLYLPIEQFDRVTKYVGNDGLSPTLTRLNTHDWSKAVHKARVATRKLAFDLVEVYSKRANVKGFNFDVTDEAKELLSATFPFEETPDQQRAIEDVYADMASSRVMDRLVCGDVGFGKTEVAMRAAFIAKKSGKQTMLLCPTTILAQQHYENFKERLVSLGASVDVMSRFRTTKQQKDTLSAFANGELDILIGTHRLLSRDVNPKNLGLVVVDEEQRFGVGHKEQLKNLRETIDVLTLSATPIPRTLQMSLSGVREMSLIMTPPSSRLPVKVHVGVWDSDVVSDAIRTELARGGQIYYVSNRVNSIEFAYERVHEVAPEARIGVAHGQMTKTELESVMEDFSGGAIDVLIATTIIESGIDNPHTNTLIIEDSHRLGLSQMYQLKGRVGRSKMQAYAYFMFPENIPLTQEAQSRLLALDEHQELGSGLRIAMRDLEIRGAGEMFGAEQSGNMSQVGFDLFAAMLNEAIVKERSGDTSDDETISALSDIAINIAEDAYIPDDYIEDVGERVLFYRKISFATDHELVASAFSEMTEKYPEPPDAAINVFARADLRIFCSEHDISSISIAKGYLSVEPVEVSSEVLSDLREFSALYSKTQKRLRVPIRNIRGDDNKFSLIHNFLKDYLDN